MKKNRFTTDEVLLIALLTLVQFTVVLDFAVLAPLGAQLMRALQISAAQFSLLVSAYAISAGASGFLLAGISDRYDRKQLLLFMYIGFIVGTLLCALANSYVFLVGARITAGVFGGVMSGISLAIVSDMFKLEVRGTVMGFIQMAFSASQILGIPLGLYMAHKWSWNTPFYLIVLLGIINAVLIGQYVKPMNAHLQASKQMSILKNLIDIAKNRRYQLAFFTTFFMATGGFMLMPFSSPYLVYNVGIADSDLPFVFLFAGIGTFIFTPIFGQLSDRLGKFKIFAIGSMFSGIMVYFYVTMGHKPLAWVIGLYSLLMIAVSSRISSSIALISAVPEPTQRGAFMNINSAVQQVSGGIATLIAGAVLVQNTDGSFQNFEQVGYITMVSLALCLVLMFNISRMVNQKPNPPQNTL